MDETLDLLTRSWAGEHVTGGDFPVGPPPANGNRVSILIGGTSDAAVRRVIAYGDGWTAGGGGPDAMAPMVQRIRQEWQAAGREGEPRFAALSYFGLGDPDASRASLRRYYAFLGEWVDAITEGAQRTPDAVQGVAKQFEEVGVTELIFMPTVPDLAEVDRLADAIL
jgi:alkanesulfonate monooxygenase SsuD/methylene tetrahydromethanopterin reductase-like flavin-dependent oxidoreductase (luciferase family)